VKKQADTPIFLASDGTGDESTIKPPGGLLGGRHKFDADGIGDGTNVKLPDGLLGDLRKFSRRGRPLRIHRFGALLFWRLAARFFISTERCFGVSASQ